MSVDRPLSIGVSLPTYGAFPQGASAFLTVAAQVLDGGGTAAIWVPDHLLLPAEDVRANGGRPGEDEPLDAWAVLALLAGVTRQVGLGTEVSPLPLRPPVALAKLASSLDVLSGGRVELGIGAGWYEPEFQAAGVPFEGHADRLARTREAAVLVRRLLEGEVVDASGGAYEVEGAVARPRLAGRRPRIWVGGRSQRVLRLAAEVGDGWIAATNASPDEVAAGIVRLRELASAAGRDPAELSVAVPFVARIASSTDRARDDVAAYVRRGAFEGFVKQFLEDATWEHGIWGSAEDCARRLAPYRALGVDQAILDVRPPDTTLDSCERIVNELIPLLERS